MTIKYKVTGLKIFYINFLSTICLTCRTVWQTISKLLIYAHNKS